MSATGLLGVTNFIPEYLLPCIHRFPLSLKILLSYEYKSRLGIHRTKFATPSKLFNNLNWISCLHIDILLDDKPTFCMLHKVQSSKTYRSVTKNLPTPNIGEQTFQFESILKDMQRIKRVIEIHFIMRFMFNCPLGSRFRTKVSASACMRFIAWYYHIYGTLSACILMDSWCNIGINRVYHVRSVPIN